MNKKFILSISLCALFLFSLKSCYESEIIKISIETLPIDRINSINFPWSVNPNLITQVKNYHEVVDIDSNNWIAQFELLPGEVKELSSILNELNSNSSYSCNISNVNWELKREICSYEKMKMNGFRGYFYNPELCESGCKQMIILWVDEKTGESYIIGSPDYDK